MNKKVYFRILITLLSLFIGFNACAQSTTQNTVQNPTQKESSPEEVVVTGEQKVSAWFRAESEHFIIYSDTTREAVTQLLNNIERLKFLLHIATQTHDKADTGQKITLYYLAHIRDLKQIDSYQPTEAIGLYNSCAFGTQGFGVHLGYPRNPDVSLEKQLNNVGMSYLFEAYARHFVYRYTNLHTPTWFIDGFAQYFASTRFSDTEALVAMPPKSIGDYLNFIGSGHTYSLDFTDILLQNDSKGHNYAGTAGIHLEFEAKSWILTHYILSSGENIRYFNTYVELITQGIEPTKAFAQAFNYKVSKLSNTLWKYRNRTAEGLKVKFTDVKAATITFSTLALSADKLLLADAALKSCPTPKAGALLLQNIADEAKKFPNNALAQMVLSRAQIDWGNPQDARPYLIKTVKKEPANFQALYLLGLAQLRLAEQEQPQGTQQQSTQQQSTQQQTYSNAAKSILFLARELAPESAEAAYAYFRAGVLAEISPTNEILSSAIRAWQLTYENNIYASASALVLAYLGRIPEAQKTLSLIAQNTRDPLMAEWAKKWQVRLQADVSRADLLAEMRLAPRPNSGFKEWTVASDQVMQAVERGYGLEAVQGFIQDQALQNQTLQSPANTPR